MISYANHGGNVHSRLWLRRWLTGTGNRVGWLWMAVSTYTFHEAREKQQNRSDRREGWVSCPPSTRADPCPCLKSLPLTGKLVQFRHHYSICIPISTKQNTLKLSLNHLHLQQELTWPSPGLEVWFPLPLCSTLHRVASHNSFRWPLLYIIPSMTLNLTSWCLRTQATVTVLRLEDLELWVLGHRKKRTPSCCSCPLGWVS